jgi:hypothetical protein
MVLCFTKQFPQHKRDLEQEALVGLVLAEQHRDCPVGDDEFRAFAHSFVWKRANRYVRDMLQAPAGFVLTGASSADECPVARQESNRAKDHCDWVDFRSTVAGSLGNTTRDVFLGMYGEDSYRTLAEVGEELGMSFSLMKKRHAAVLEAIRELPYFQQVA